MDSGIKTVRIYLTTFSTCMPTYSKTLLFYHMSYFFVVAYLTLYMFAHSFYTCLNTFIILCISDYFCMIYCFLSYV